MFRRLLWLTVVCMLFFAAGCSSKETADNDENTKTSPTQTEEKDHENEKTSNSSPGNNENKPDSKSPGTDQNEKNEPDTGNDTIIKAVEQDGQRTIHYPQLNMKDKGEEQKINDLIYSDITAYASQYDGGTLTVDYQIKWYTMETLSIFYTAEFSGGAYPGEHVYLTSLNLETGEKIALPNLVEINEDFVQLLKESPYLDPENPASPNKDKKAAILDYLDSIGVPELVNALQHADEINPGTNSHNIYSCIQGHHVIVSIGVPHALGDHAEFKVSLD